MPEYTTDFDEPNDLPLASPTIDPDAPDEIAQFVESLGLSDKFRCLIRKTKPGAQGYYTIADLKNVVPTVEQIGKDYGPGQYHIAFTWYPPKGTPKVGGKAGSLVKTIPIDLPDIPWKRIHLLHMAKLEQEDQEALDRLRREGRERAITRAIEDGRTPGSAGNGLEAVKDAVQMLKELGIPVGGGTAKSVDWEKVVAAGATLLPIVVSLFKREDGLTTKDLITLMQNNQQMLLTAVNRQNPVEANMLGLLNTVVDTAKNVMALGPGKVEEKETFAGRIFDLIEQVGPGIIQALAAKPQAERENNMLYRMAVGHPDFQALKEDKEKLIATVNRLDEAYGYEATNQILESFRELGLVRPPETEGNREKFKSPEAG